MSIFTTQNCFEEQEVTIKKEDEGSYDLFSPLSSLSEWQVPTEPESSVEVSPQWNPINIPSLFGQAMTTDVYSIEEP